MMTLSSQSDRGVSVGGRLRMNMCNEAIFLHTARNVPALSQGKPGCHLGKPLDLYSIEKISSYADTSVTFSVTQVKNETNP